MRYGTALSPEPGRRIREGVMIENPAVAITTEELQEVWRLLSPEERLESFGLLSADRREQVKDFVCGAFEQTRLLALDFQGYETEM